MTQRSVDAAAIEAEVGQIRSLGIDALRKRWRLMFGAVPSKGLTKDILGRMIAYRIQEEAFGGLDRETIKLLDRLARGEKPNELNRRLKAGTVLVREYHGERHTVTIRARWLRLARYNLFQSLDYCPGHHRHGLERTTFLRLTRCRRTESPRVAQATIGGKHEAVQAQPLLSPDQRDGRRRTRCE